MGFTCQDGTTALLKLHLQTHYDSGKLARKNKKPDCLSGFNLLIFYMLQLYVRISPLREGKKYSQTFSYV
jgi:hypothetical protein